MLIIKKVTYGTLGELSLQMGLGRSTLKVARHRNPNDFPEPVGTIAGHDVYLLHDLEAWYEIHSRPRKN